MNFAYYLHDEKSQEQFEQKLLWFKERYNLVSFKELRNHIYDGMPLKNACMLSVDDGWRSTYDIIYPVMKKHNVPFTIFVSPYVMETEKNFWYYTLRFCNEDEIMKILIRRGYFDEGVRKYPIELILKELLIDTVYDVLNEYLSAHPEIYVPRGFMNTKEVQELYHSGLVEIGAHTLIHPILKVEENGRAFKEITESVNMLSAILDKKVRCFAYPNGLENVDFTVRDEQYVKNAGLDIAFSVDPGIITPKTNPFSVPRWGSQVRLKFGRLGMYLPSRANQAKIRIEIKKHKLS